MAYILVYYLTIFYITNVFYESKSYKYLLYYYIEYRNYSSVSKDKSSATFAIIPVPIFLSPPITRSMFTRWISQD